MSGDGIDQEFQGVFLLKNAGTGGRKQPCSEKLSVLGLISETDFSPPDAGRIPLSAELLVGSTPSGSGKVKR